MSRKTSLIVKITIFFITFLGFLLRIVNLNHNPSRLTHDEMSIGYNAYSILKTGADEWGRKLPLDFEAFGDHKLPGAIYAAIPFISLFGLGNLGLKLVSILAGTILVYLVYLIVELILKDKKLALVAAFLIATSPWTIHFSRMMLESNLALTLFTAGLFFQLKAWKNRKGLYFILSGLLFGLTFYFYIAYRMISLLIFISLLAYGFVYQKNKKCKNTRLGLISFLLIIFPLFSQLFSQGGTARFNQVSFLTDPGLESKVQEMHNYCFMNLAQTSPLLATVCRKVLNKPFFLLKNFASNYLLLIFPTFLFVTGDPLLYLRNPDFGQFFIILAPLYLFGLIRLTKINKRIRNLVLLLLFIAPIPSALTGEPQTVRASGMIIPIVLILTLGWQQLLLWLKSIKKERLVYLFTVVYVGWLTVFLANDHLLYAHQSAQYFYELPFSALDKTEELKNNFDFVYIDDEFPDAHIALAFHTKIDPSYYQTNIIRPNPDEVGFSHPTHLGKYQFGDKLLSTFLCQDEEKVLFVTRNYQDLEPTYEFKDFSQVHTHTQLFDLPQIKEKLSEKKLEKICQ
ncbi:MAG: glycosyltransferase family 39 protein [Patescibacteria group bacterium]|nr:glycosyltransferase family 39 protein [Patescibacteria group bacterium]